MQQMGKVGRKSGAGADAGRNTAALGCAQAACAALGRGLAGHSVRLVAVGSWRDNYQGSCMSAVAWQGGSGSWQAAAAAAAATQHVHRAAPPLLPAAYQALPATALTFAFPDVQVCAGCLAAAGQHFAAQARCVGCGAGRRPRAVAAAAACGCKLPRCTAGLHMQPAGWAQPQLTACLLAGSRGICCRMWPVSVITQSTLITAGLASWQAAR